MPVLAHLYAYAPPKCCLGTPGMYENVQHSGHVHELVMHCQLLSFKTHNQLCQLLMEEDLLHACCMVKTMLSKSMLYKRST